MPPKKTQPRVWKHFLKAVVASLALYFAYVGTIAAIRYRAVNLLSRYDAERALQTMHTLEKLTSTTPSDQQVLLRIYRKLGDIKNFRRIAKQLDDAGQTNFTSTQKILFQAQGGRIAEVTGHLASLLIASADGNGEQNLGQDTCEAFANGFLGSYQLPQAEEVLSVWARQFPEDPQACVIRGRLEEHRGNWDGALDSYQTALEHEPGYGPAAYNAARIHLNRNQPESALKLYQSASRWLVDDTPARVGMANCYRLLDQPHRAREALMPAVSPPMDDELRVRSFRLVGELPGAAETAALTELGQLELAAEHFVAAVAALSSAATHDPQNHTVRYLLARAMVGAGRKDDAAEHFEAYRAGNEATQKLATLMDQVAVKPNNTDLRCDIGEILLTHYTENQGLIWLASVLKFDAGHQRANQLLAEYYVAKSETTGDKSYLDLAKQHSERLHSDTIGSESNAPQ